MQIGYLALFIFYLQLGLHGKTILLFHGLRDTKKLVLIIIQLSLKM